MLEPFADYGEPPDPDPRPLVPNELVADEPPEPEPEAEPTAQETPEDGISRPPSDEPAQVGLMPVPFPVLLAGASYVDFECLEEPSRRVAELVEAIQPVLAPPAVIAQLEALVLKANALKVVDAASFEQGCELYELLAANERGIEEGSIGRVVSFFHRPWKAMTEFRARFAKPVELAKRRLSDDCSAWKRAEVARAKEARRVEEDRLADEERQRLQEIAAVARSQGQLAIAEQATQMATEVVAAAAPLRSVVPQTPTKGRSAWVAEIVDEALIYQGIADGTIPRAAAPIDLAFFTRQAKDLKEELAKRYPGVRAYDKGGLTASGRR